MAGLIAAAMAGGLAGGGAAAQDAFKRQADQQNKIDFAQVQAEVDKSKWLAIEEVRNQYATTARKDEQQFTLGRDAVAYDRQSERDSLDREHRSGESALERAARSSESEKDRAHNEKLAAERNATTIRAAGIGASRMAQAGSLEKLGDGRMAYIRDGKVVNYLTDPTTGDPILVAKDVSESAMKAADSYFKEADAIDKEGNPDRAGEASRLRQRGRDLLTGGGGKAGSSAPSGNDPFQVRPPTQPPSGEPPVVVSPKSNRPSQEEQLKAERDKMQNNSGRAWLR